MFGCNQGVATLLMNDFPSLIANRCISHRKALGLKHAMESIVYMSQTFVPLLKSVGNSMKTSDKKNSMLAEQNEADGTDAVAVGTVSFTRWDAFCDHLMRLCKDPKTFATHCKTFLRAGEGGESDDHILGAGRSDPAALGVYYGMRLQEFVATATSLLDFLPMLKAATKRFEAHDLDHETARHVVSNLLEKLKQLVDNFETHATRSNAWREFVDGVRAAGVNVKATGGRSEVWIDKMIRTFAKALYSSHEEIMGDLEILAALQHLFDVNADGFPQPGTLPLERDLDEYYEQSMEIVIQQ